MSAALETELADLPAMRTKELRAKWESLYGSPAPRISAALLRSGIAWKIQAEQQGGYSKQTIALLRSTNGAAGMPQRMRKLTPGTRLVRDWHCIGHSVTVLKDGFEYDGKRWRSLTAIARHITGAKWSGPRFFGLAR
jgi:hypothetical protein